MTSTAFLIIGTLSCILALLFLGLVGVVIRDYPLYVHGPQDLARALSYTPAGRTRNDAPFWYVGKMGDRPVGLAFTQIQYRQGLHRGRSVRKEVLRFVVGCRFEGRLDVQFGSGTNRAVLAEGVDPQPLYELAGANGFGLVRIAKATRFESPNATFANDGPALCWLDHPDIRLTDRREAAKLLDRLDRIVTRLESR